MQNIVVIGRVYSQLEHSEFSSNFEFDRNMLSGTGARARLPMFKTSCDPRYDNGAHDWSLTSGQETTIMIGGRM